MKKKISFIAIAFMFAQYGFSMELVESPQHQSKMASSHIVVDTSIGQVEFESLTDLLVQSAILSQEIEFYRRKAVISSKDLFYKCKELLSTLSLESVLYITYIQDTNLPDDFSIHTINKRFLEDCLFAIHKADFTDAERIISRLNEDVQKDAEKKIIMEETGEKISYKGWSDSIWYVPNTFLEELRKIFTQTL